MPVWLIAPEPNTWREILSALDDRRDELPLKNLRVAVQEYGVSNPDLLAGLRDRAAIVTAVPVYQWALPEDLEPLRAACRTVASGNVDVALFTTATQVVHLLKVAETMGLRGPVSDGLRKVVVASIGPTTSEELRDQGVAPRHGSVASEDGISGTGSGGTGWRITDVQAQGYVGLPADRPRNTAIWRSTKKLRSNEPLNDAVTGRGFDSPEACSLGFGELHPGHLVELATHAFDEPRKIFCAR